MQSAIQATQSEHSTPISPSGDAGGRILFACTPEALAATDTHTARHLRDELARDAHLTDDVDEEDVDLDALAGDDDEEPDTDEVIEDEEEAAGETVG